MNVPDFFFNTFDINIGKYSLPVPIFQAVAVVILLFALILTLAHVRKHSIEWSFKGAAFGIFFGFLLALILEAFLLIYGHTAITGVLGWKNAPKPISIALDAGRSKLANIVGKNVQVDNSVQEKDVIKQVQSLNPEELKKLKSILCAP